MQSFEQAAIKVEREKEFDALKATIENAFSAEKVEGFLKRLSREGVRVRDWDGVVGKALLDKDGKASKLYQELTVSDQAQMREFYLSRLEEVDQKLRTKFHRIYQYY